MATHKKLTLQKLSDTIRAFAGIVKMPKRVNAEEQAWKQRIERQT
jgi:hypothetical protein